MPELCRFLGIVIRMFAEVGVPHATAHFHVQYQEHAAVYGIDPVERLEGSLPQRQTRLVEAWAELHRDELMRDWELLQNGRPPTPIEPLH